MILAAFCFILAALVIFVLLKGGIQGIARNRTYKSGTGWCFWRWTDVDSEYIRRLHIVKTPWCALCLHWIRKPDEEPWLHDHPVSFLSIILRGSYAEIRQRADDLSPRIIVHRWFNFIRAEKFDRHRIIFARRHTLTLCLMGPKTREWGFHTRDGWKGWKDYYTQKREAPVFLDKYTTVEFFNTHLDKMSDDWLAKYTGKIFLDEEIRKIDEGDADEFSADAITEYLRRGR